MTQPTGDWNSYAKLVLAELSRHNDILQTIDEKVDGIRLQNALYEKEIGSQREDLEFLREEFHQTVEEIRVELQTIKDESEESIGDAEERIDALEGRYTVDTALKEYRNWLIGLGFVLVTSLLLPIGFTIYEFLN